MLLHRTVLRWLSGWLITTILFTQVAVAAYTCPQVLSRADANSSAMVGMPCAETMSKALASDTTLDANQPGLCLQHCQFGSTGGQPADNAAPVGVAIVAWLLLFTLIPTAARPVGGLAWTVRQRRRDRARPPPHSILHCCHRI